jgi:hypothetical protein
VDGQRTNPSDQEPRWHEGERGYGEPRRRETYRDDAYRVPEPRGGSTDTPSFDGFTERTDKTEDTGGHRWDGPPYQEQPSWLSQEPTLLPTARPPGPEAPPRPVDPEPYQRPEPFPPPERFGQNDPFRSGEPFRPMEPFRPNDANDPKPVSAHPVSANPVSGNPVSTEPLEAPTGAMPPIAPPAGAMPPIAPPAGAMPPIAPPAGAMPPIAPHDFPMDETRYHAEPIDRAALRRQPPPGAAVPAGDGVYRTRRPAIALVYVILTVIFELGALRVLLDGLFGGPFVPGQTVSGMFLVAGLPIFALGLYGATSGGVRTEAGAWARPPVVYLVAGLGLLLAAALA